MICERDGCDSLATIEASRYVYEAAIDMPPVRVRYQLCPTHAIDAMVFQGAALVQLEAVTGRPADL